MLRSIRTNDMKPASIMSHLRNAGAALQYLQPEYACSRANEALRQEGFVPVR